MRAPGPSTIPYFGALSSLRKDPLIHFPALRREYGGVVALGQMGGRPYYLVSEPQAIRHVMLDNYKNYQKGRASQRMKAVLGTGSLLLEGDVWRQRRKLLQPMFHRTKIATLCNAFVEAASKVADGWAAEGGAFDVRAEMLKLAMTLTVRNMFAADATGKLSELIGAWQVLYGEITRVRKVSLFGAKRPDPKVVEARATIHRVLGDLIEEKKRAPDDSLLSMLVQVRDEETGAGLSDQELRDEVMTIFVGGYETTSTAMGFTLGLLADHPAIAAQHRAHLDEVLGSGLPTMETLPKLTFNRHVIEESMRLFPPSWMVTREAIAADTVGGFAIEPGAQMLLSAYVVHHAPDIWPDPERFDPARFEVEPERTKFTYFPFGGGPRICLGDTYAITEIQLIIAVLCKRFVFERATSEPLLARAQAGLTPAHPIVLTPVPR